MQIKIVSFFTILTCFLGGEAFAQTTAFTYQGRLTSSNSPANGSYDLQFTLYNSVSSGAIVGGPVTNAGIVLTNGLFSAPIDFGITPFSGADVWLEIALRTNGAASFGILRPRQRITTSPYAIRAAGVADGSITATKLSSGAGANGQVLKMNGGVLAWGTDLNSGGVTSIGTGTGLVGGPITTFGTISIDTTAVPRLGAANTFTTGQQTIQSGGSATKGLVLRGAAGQTANLQEWQDSGSSVLASISPAGVFGGSGANLTGLNAGNLSSGTVPDARLSGNVPLLNASQNFTGSNTFSGGTAFANAANRFVGAFVGNGAGLSNVTVSSTLAGDVTGSTAATTVARIRGVNVIPTAPLANQHLRFTGTDWTPAAVALGTDVSGSLAVANGGTGASTASAARASLGAAASGGNSDITSLSGLTTPLSASQGGSGQSSYTAGDLLYASASTSLARLPDAVAGNSLISGGTGVAPSWGKIGLTTHVAGTLAVANGGSGLSTYAAGDIIYAPAVNTLARLAIAANGQSLGISGGLPTWLAANAHNHFGQNWTGTAIDGLFMQNDSNASGASALTGSATDTVGLNYGVYGQSLSENGIGVQGTAFGSSGLCTGVSGESTSSSGIGVYGLASASAGTPTGVYGEASSTNGVGVYGIGTASTGVPVGVYGEAASATGYGLYTPNRLFVGGTAFIGGHISMQPIARIFADTGSAIAPSVSFGSNSTSGLFSPGTNMLSFGTAATERLRIVADGKMGLGRIPLTNLFEVAGEASKNTAGGWFANSDARIKMDVRDLPDALETIDRIHPVSFRYTQEYRDAHSTIEDKKYYNVIAQEFEKVFPESVKESGETLEGKPILQVDTYPASIYAIAAIQELHRLVKAKDSELAKLKEQNANLEQRLARLEKLAETLESKPVAGSR